ncbi:MAG: Heme/hemopexin-binding protein [Chlamydiae bacterium]|nr:Heme/hemopexin-binding protein [Chlamydiota bacterium]
MKTLVIVFISLTISVLSNPIEPTVETGRTHFLHPSSKTLLIQASSGAIINWKEFSVNADELTRFIQPSNDSWVLNRVTGSNISEIFGQLESNGQVILLNPNGILFGEGSIVEVGGLIASCAEGAVWSQEGVKRPHGSVVNHGVIRATCGDVVLVGREVRNEGRIEILLQTDRDILIRTGQKWDRVKAEDNPYGFAINCSMEDAHCIISEGGRILLKSDERTLVRGSLFGSKVTLLSEGLTLFEGYADVGSGSIEISGREGFIHNGTIYREGGTLLLDPEGDVTISKTVNYNHLLEDGVFSPTADVVNISIDKLIEEIGKGPVTITTSYQGEGGGFGSIIIKDDVDQTYESPYPLLLFSSGWGGVNIEGSLTNTGEGSIELRAPRGELSIPGALKAQHVVMNAERIHVQGEIFGRAITLAGEKGIDIEGVVQVDGGDLLLLSKGSIMIRDGTLSNLGAGRLRIDGLNGAPVQNVTIVGSGGLFTSSHSKELVLENVEGKILIDGGAVAGNNAPIRISGAGSLQIKNGTLMTHAPISINLGRYLHIDDGRLSTAAALEIDLGEDLLMTGSALLSSPGGMTLNAKGDVMLTESSTIRGRGISISGGESLSLFMNASIEGGSGPLFISAGRDIILEKGSPKISAGQLQLHAGNHLLMENLAEINSRLGTASITAGLAIHLSDSALIRARGGDLSVIASQGNINLFGMSSLSSLTHAATIIAGKSLVMENSARINSIGNTGTTIVVDHQNSGGGLVMAPRTSITTGEAPLRIFTARRAFNSIQGRLNGYPLIESPLYLTTNSERWGTNYPNLSYSSHFLLFHKESGLIQLVAGGISQKEFDRVVINFIGPFTAELFRDLHPYDEYTKNVVEFKSNEEPFRIHKRPLGEKGKFL